MDTLQKVEFTALICHIEKFSKSGIPIHKSEVPNMACRKRTRSRPRLRRLHFKRTNRTAENHAIKGSGDFMEGSFSLYLTTLLGLVAIGIVVVDMCF